MFKKYIIFIVLHKLDGDYVAMHGLNVFLIEFIYKIYIEICNAKYIFLQKDEVIFIDFPIQYCEVFNIVVHFIFIVYHPS